MDIVHQIEIISPPAKVYEAITTSKGIQGWWAQNSDIATRPGNQHTMNFVKEGNAVVMKFRVDDMQANQKVSWTCTENGNPAWVGTTIQFDLAKNNGNTQLKFSHLGWDKKFEGTPLYVSVGPTWEAFMGSLKRYCETGVGQPW